MTGAQCYPILSATTGVNNLLAADLRDPADRRIVDLCDEDIMANRYDGKPGTESVYPAFASYASRPGNWLQRGTKSPVDSP